jgi:transposase-like protein
METAVTRTAGRPKGTVLLTEEPEVAKRFIEARSRASTINAACGAANISPVTYYSWKKQAEADKEAGIESVYTEFIEAADLAHNRAQYDYVTTPIAVSAAKREAWAIRMLAYSIFKDEWHKPSVGTTVNVAVGVNNGEISDNRAEALEVLVSRVSRILAARNVEPVLPQLTEGEYIEIDEDHDDVED